MIENIYSPCGLRIRLEQEREYVVKKGSTTRPGGTGFTLSTWETEAGIEVLCGLGSR